tara:strand:+ start:498 stop:644 length:147 start_codon:yes stop_codon:yes gene_type:complete
MEIFYMSEENKNKEPKVENIDLDLTAEEEKLLKKKLEELRKRDPFVYR